MAYITTVLATYERLEDEKRRKIHEILEWHNVRKVVAKRQTRDNVRLEIRIWTSRKLGKKTLERLVKELNAVAGWTREEEEGGE